jgi:ADP-ribose pyrophosphatase YjhB (NUDIX family)
VIFENVIIESMNKKIISTILFILTVVVLVVLASFVNSNKQALSSEECLKLDSSRISSERSLGLVIENNEILAVRLNDEKNYSPPGGHNMYGEISERALTRELNEEVGVNVDGADLERYKTVCETTGTSIERTHYYKVDVSNATIELKQREDRIKWVSYDFISNKKADTELKQALEFLKQDGLIN